MLEDFRLLILQNLKERDNKCGLFERVFDARVFILIIKILIKFFK